MKLILNQAKSFLKLLFSSYFSFSYFISKFLYKGYSVRLSIVDLFFVLVCLCVSHFLLHSSCSSSSSFASDGRLSKQARAKKKNKKGTQCVFWKLKNMPHCVGKG